MPSSHAFYLPSASDMTLMPAVCWLRPKPLQACTEKVASVAQVVGYMGVPYYNTDMTSHPQYITIRNERGQEMLDCVNSRLEVIPTMSSGNRKPFVLQTVISDDE